MNKFLIILIVGLVVISSCSPERKLSRLLKKHPELVKSDTVTRIDTVYSSSVRHDTTLSIQRIISSNDTIYFTKERLTQKIFYHNDSIYIQGECAPDTIIREVPVTVYKTEVKPSFIDNISWWQWMLFTFFVTTFCIYKFGKPL